MKVQYHSKDLYLFFLILLVGVSTLLVGPSAASAAGAKTSNYYLGVLAQGYPQSMVVSEFQYANAEVVNIDDNMVLFGINQNTKLTTFLKNLPFLKEVYVDAESLKGNISLSTNPLAREFLFLLQSGKDQPGKPPHLKDLDSQDSPTLPGNAKGSADAGDDTASSLKKGSLGKSTGLETNQNNLVVIDKLIREKAEKTKKNRATQGTIK